MFDAMSAKRADVLIVQGTMIRGETPSLELSIG
jgi:hypothetical protein